MSQWRFNPGPIIIGGDDVATRLAELLPDGACLFVTDTHMIESGLAAPFRDAIAAAGHDVHLFDAVEADPSRTTLEAATALGVREGVSHVVGFGGGSPMDVAKLAAYLIGSGDELDTIWGVEQASGEGLPLALVPTTAGTGSEATPVSIITCEGGEKRGVNARAIGATWAALDPGLTVGKPRALTAATGIDAMVHAIEAFTSAKAKNPLSDMLAKQALKLLADNLLTACEEPQDREARAAMLLGAHLAGLAFANAPVAGVHALAYPLGGLYHLPHGLSNALMLRPVLEHNSEAARELYADLAPIIDPDCEGEASQGRTQRLIAKLEELVVASGLKPRLRDHDIPREDIPTLAREAMKQQRLLVNNPCEITEADAARLYEAAW